MGLGIPEQEIDEEVGWHSRNTRLQVHGVTRSKKEGKVIADMIKWYDRINSQ